MMKKIKLNDDSNLQSKIVNWAYDQMTREEKREILREMNKKLDEELFGLIFESLKKVYVHHNERYYTISSMTLVLWRFTIFWHRLRVLLLGGFCCH